MERKAQELCQETREQYELLLQRQETAHERQLQAARATLQQVLSASISLADHQQLVASEKEAARRERDELVAQHSRELRRAQRAEAQRAEVDKWTRKLQSTQQHLVGKVDALKARCAQLELDKSLIEAALTDRERELCSLRGILREAEHKQHEAEARVEEACRHLSSLRVHLRRSDARSRRAEISAKAAAESTHRAREKLAGKDVAIAEARGRAEVRAASIETQLEHTQEVLETERKAVQALQVRLFHCP
jgi:chromosome segregation ATPase